MAKNQAGSAKKQKNLNRNREDYKNNPLEPADIGESPVSIMEIHEYLSGVEYPAEKNELLDHAERQGAPVDVLDALNEIGEKHYGVPADVSEELASYR